MNPAKLEKKFQLFYESPNNVPPPYHLEAAFEFTEFLSDAPTVKLTIQYIDRDDFSREELLAEGLNTDDTFVWEGSLPIAWRNRLEDSFRLYKSGSCDPRDEEPFITLEAADTTTALPVILELDDTLIQEFMQAILETAGKEMPLYLGFQFADEDGLWVRIEGELSFFNLSFRYSKDANDLIRFTDDWKGLQELMAVSHLIPRSYFYPFFCTQSHLIQNANELSITLQVLPHEQEKLNFCLKLASRILNGHELAEIIQYLPEQFACQYFV
jgi:hypothetical protein